MKIILDEFILILYKNVGCVCISETINRSYLFFDWAHTQAKTKCFVNAVFTLQKPHAVLLSLYILLSKTWGWFWVNSLDGWSKGKKWVHHSLCLSFTCGFACCCHDRHAAGLYKVLWEQQNGEVYSSSCLLTFKKKRLSSVCVYNIKNNVYFMCGESTQPGTSFSNGRAGTVHYESLSQFGFALKWSQMVACFKRRHDEIFIISFKEQVHCYAVSVSNQDSSWRCIKMTNIPWYNLCSRVSL